MGELKLWNANQPNQRLAAIGRRIGAQPDRFDAMLWATDPRFYEDFPGWRADLIKLDPNIAARGERFRLACRPLKEIEPKLNGQMAGEILAGLGTIATKIAPTMDADAAERWAAAMIMALSDMPPPLTLEAISAAIHVPIRFISDVESVIRNQARLPLLDYERVDMRLRELLARPNWPRLLPTLPPIKKERSRRDEPGFP